MKIKKKPQQESTEAPAMSEDIKKLQPVLEFVVRYVLAAAVNMPHKATRQGFYRAARDADLALHSLGFPSAVFSYRGMVSTTAIHAHAQKVLSKEIPCPYCDVPERAKTQRPRPKKPKKPVFKKR